MSIVFILLRDIWRNAIFQAFLRISYSLFFTASNHIEELMSELEEAQVNIEVVNRMLEITTMIWKHLKKRRIILFNMQTLTEQLLQYSNSLPLI